jgi:hypothetical protein
MTISWMAPQRDLGTSWRRECHRAPGGKPGAPSSVSWLRLPIAADYHGMELYSNLPRVERPTRSAPCINMPSRFGLCSSFDMARLWPRKLVSWAQLGVSLGTFELLPRQSARKAISRFQNHPQIME